MMIQQSRLYLHRIYSQHNMTQTQVANDVLHIDPATLSRYTSGVSPWPLHIIKVLKEYFNIPDTDVYDVFIKPYA